MYTEPRLVVFLSDVTALVDGHSGVDAADGFPAAKVAETTVVPPADRPNPTAGVLEGVVVEVRDGVCGEPCPVAIGDRVRLTGWTRLQEAELESPRRDALPPPLTAEQRADRMARARLLRDHVRKWWREELKASGG